MATERTKTTIREFIDFIAQNEQAGERYELINGEIVEMAPVGYPHSKTTIRLIRILGDYVEAGNYGEISTELGTFDQDNDKNLFAPDVAFYRAERFPEPEGFLNILPDWVIEVVSPSDAHNKAARIDAKIKQYQAARIPLLWYIYPNRREIDVYRPDTPMQTYKVGDTISAADVLPGFSIEVKTIFR